MPTVPSLIQPRPTAKAGTGLFTTHPIAAGEGIFCIDQPLVAVLDSPHLRDTCANCFLLPPSNGDDYEGAATGSRQGWRGEASQEENIRLKGCLGCKVVKYCSKVG